MGLGCGLSFSGSSPEIWGRNGVWSRPGPSQPFLALNFCPPLPAPRSAVLFLPLLLPASQVAPRWRNFTMRPGESDPWERLLKRPCSDTLHVPATCPAQLMLSWAGHAPAGNCWGPALRGYGDAVVDRTRDPGL